MCTKLYNMHKFKIYVQLIRSSVKIYVQLPQIHAIS